MFCPANPEGNATLSRTLYSFCSGVFLKHDLQTLQAFFVPFSIMILDEKNCLGMSAKYVLLSFINYPLVISFIPCRSNLFSTKEQVLIQIILEIT